jgi:hypothetical protein
MKYAMEKTSKYPWRLFITSTNIFGHSNNIETHIIENVFFPNLVIFPNIFSIQLICGSTFTGVPHYSR